MPYRFHLPCRRQAETAWDFTGLMKHPCLQMTAPSTRIAREGKPYRVSPEDRAGVSISMLRTKGGGSHVIQATALPFGVSLAGLFATPVSCSALATSLPSWTPGVLPTFSVRVRTRTGRIKSVAPPRIAPFLIRLSVSPIRLTRPFGAFNQLVLFSRANALGYHLSPLRG